ncbi:MAG: tRNA (adenosine(37)-N6)-threonylcarbamoyltransferase complex ATPase subunit type 1 TsaE, partial [Thermoguttaceae bacterium]|nr:tRNA (adenosine(37)-N6)-threonylcarbamoyltransferase complex ATPase subunit type 1 TsaE [Thermoguttaceae bacterium]
MSVEIIVKNESETDRLGAILADILPDGAVVALLGTLGAGKTRLVEGICQSRRLREPRKTFYYMSGSDFYRALLDAVKREQTAVFRRLFGQADVVTIENADDVAEREAARARESFS